MNLPGTFSYLLTFLIALSGALLAVLLRMPIPWLLGSLFACALAMIVGLPIKTLPNLVERWMRVAIGVSIGPSVAASVSVSGNFIPLLIAAAVLVTSVTVIAGTRWFEIRTGLPRPSAFLTALPGGLSMLLAMAGDIGNRAQVVMAHTVRVVIVVVSISLLARFLGVPAEPSPLLTSFQYANGSSPLVLLTLIVVCFVLAEKIHIAGGHVIFPMFITALLSLMTDIPLTTPNIVNTTALFVFGIVLGCEVAGGPRETYGSLFKASAIFTIAIMALSALVAGVLSSVTNPEFLVLFLALAPGGIAEVSLVALALGLDAGLVALVHSCRFLYIILAGPAGLHWLQKRDNSTPKT